MAARARDARLERAVQVALELLEKNPPPVKPKQPDDPSYHNPNYHNGGQ